MSYTVYKETIDYSWVVARSLDRLAEALARIDPRAPGVGVRKALIAARALLTIVQPFVERDVVASVLGEAEKHIAANKHWQALTAIEEAVNLILEDLDKKKLLIRGKDLMGVVEE